MARCSFYSRVFPSNSNTSLGTFVVKYRSRGEGNSDLTTSNLFIKYNRRQRDQGGSVIMFEVDSPAERCELGTLHLTWVEHRRRILLFEPGVKIAELLSTRETALVSPQTHFKVNCVLHCTAGMMLPDLIKLCTAIGSTKVTD